jgi:hypothetical protein
MLSMQTLLGAEDWYQLGYADLADLLRQVSRPPGGRPARAVSPSRLQRLHRQYRRSPEELRHAASPGRLAPDPRL